MRSEVLAAVKMSIVAFWVELHPEDGGSMLLRNVDQNLEDLTAS
jgi:hypothetical protein